MSKYSYDDDDDWAPATETDWPVVIIICIVALIAVCMMSGMPILIF